VRVAIGSRPGAETGRDAECARADALRSNLDQALAVAREAVQAAQPVVANPWAHAEMIVVSGSVSERVPDGTPLPTEISTGFSPERWTSRQRNQATSELAMRPGGMCVRHPPGLTLAKPAKAHQG
jgi:hypothetical protein